MTDRRSGRSGQYGIDGSRLRVKGVQKPQAMEDSVYLAPAAQGQGVGGRLLAALIDASRATGDRTMVAAIEAGNTASIRLHERHGFTLIGTIPQAGEKHGQILDLTLMSRRLDPHGPGPAPA